METDLFIKAIKYKKYQKNHLKEKIMKNFTSPMLLCDFYKISHRNMYPQGTEYIYSTWTPRTSRIDGIDEVVVFGIQKFIKKYLIEFFNENFFGKPIDEIVNDYKRIIKYSLGIENVEVRHIVDLYHLGYLPIKIKAIDEGISVPIRVPFMTIENTDPKFFWLTNYIESLASCELWQGSTSATISKEFKKLLIERAKRTGGDVGFVDFQGHDFSFRGMSSLDSAISSGMGHLLSFCGTDTIPAIQGAEYYYGADVEKEMVGCSISATEHSIQCTYEDDYKYIEDMITKIHPSGFVSIVSDGYDFWDVMENILPALKDKIMARDGKCVIRPDSGNVVDIICGTVQPKNYKGYCETLECAMNWMEEDLLETVKDSTAHGQCGEHKVSGYFSFEGQMYKMKISIDWNRYDKKYYFIDDHKILSCEKVDLSPEQKGAVQMLYETFGGSVNPKGFIDLDSHIGLIYGDSITLDICKKVCDRLEEKGFSSTNVVYGVGSYTYQYNTRDTFGFALKTTSCIIDGVEKPIFKDPKTDSGIKKSQKGRVNVKKDEDGKFFYVDGLNKENESNGENYLTDVFCNGQIMKNMSFAEVKKNLFK